MASEFDWKRVSFDEFNIDFDVERISFDEFSGHHHIDKNGDCALMGWDKWENVRTRLLALEMAYKALAI